MFVIFPVEDFTKARCFWLYPEFQNEWRVNDRAVSQSWCWPLLRGTNTERGLFLREWSSRHCQWVPLRKIKAIWTLSTLLKVFTLVKQWICIVYIIGFDLYLWCDIFQMIRSFWVPVLSCCLIFARGVPLGSCCTWATPTWHDMDPSWAITSLSTCWEERWVSTTTSVTKRCEQIWYLSQAFVHTINLSKIIYIICAPICRLWHK